MQGVEAAWELGQGQSVLWAAPKPPWEVWIWGHGDLGSQETQESGAPWMGIGSADLKIPSACPPFLFYFIF